MNNVVLWLAALAVGIVLGAIIAALLWKPVSYLLNGVRATEDAERVANWLRDNAMHNEWQALEKFRNRTADAYDVKILRRMADRMPDDMKPGMLEVIDRIRVGEGA